MMKEKMIKQYEKIFLKQDPSVFYSPGRVNLIGEHIDYNGGYVMPAALSYGTYGAASLRDDQVVSVYSEGFSQSIYSFDLNHIQKSEKHKWADYIKGVFKIMIDEGYIIDKGINIYIKSTMPTNAGLSSSSSLELLVIVMLDTFFDLNISKKKMALLGKAVENKFIGVNSGIMDQFSIIMGKKDHAILLNTQNLEFKYIPLNLGDHQLLVINTNKKRGLADSKYNERFAECNEALDILKPIYQVKDLCSILLHKLKEIKQILDDTLYKRVKHVITEQNRTIESMNALQTNDIIRFADLLIASHKSLKEDYDVTGIELDTLVEQTLKAGATGARMTGAGFGGCIVAIVKKDIVDQLIKEVKENYTAVIGYEPSFYLVELSDGTKVL